MSLDWPTQFDRTPSEDREGTRKFKAGLRQTKNEIQNEMEMIDAMWRLDDDTSGDDPGVVLRWQKDGRDHAVACDAYTSKKANARAVYLWVKETRMAGDRPVRTGSDQFAAAALPSGGNDAVAGRQPAHEILGVAPDADPEAVKGAARGLKKKHHPDRGGDQETFSRVVQAEEELLGEG